MTSAQLKRDKRAILIVLKDKPKSFAQISLQAGEQLWPAMQELVAEGKIVAEKQPNDEESTVVRASLYRINS